MRRALVTLISLLLASLGVFAISYWAARHAGRSWCEWPGDELEWVRREYALKPEEMEKVRALQAAYAPRCRTLCARIAAKNQELAALLEQGAGQPMTVQQKLNDVALLRASCQGDMLRHFQAVSQAMPPEAGRRYLAEMTRLTLGSPMPTGLAPEAAHHAPTGH